MIIYVYDNIAVKFKPSRYIFRIYKIPIFNIICILQIRFITNGCIWIAETTTDEASFSNANLFLHICYSTSSIFFSGFAICIYIYALNNGKVNIERNIDMFMWLCRLCVWNCVRVCLCVCNHAWAYVFMCVCAYVCVSVSLPDRTVRLL